ncbi:Calx-beta domain-containing protein [Candidatus Poriferisodalis sp.]|uniref:Calx-beta domain-containing protein n=1 Tax=Candidatus Poriferisodalis sp. TaxID=3101277 RepID=UPI003B0126AF
MKTARRAVCGVVVALLTAASAAVVAVQPAAAHETSPQRVGLYMSGGSNRLVSEGTSFTLTAERTRGGNHASHTGTALIVPIQFSPTGGVTGRSASADDLMIPASITIPANQTTGSVTVQVVDDNIAEEFERAAIVLGHLPRGWHPAPSRIPQTRNADPDDPGSPGVYFDIRPSDVADIGRLRFRVCTRADNSCPVNGDDGWQETTTPSLTLTEGGSAKSYQYRLTPALTSFREVEVHPAHSDITNADFDRDRLTCVASADHSVFPLSSLTVLPGDTPSQCPHRPRSYGGDQIDTWRTVTYRAGQDADAKGHSVTVRHRTLARITGHPYAGHYYQDPSGERWPVQITITDDDAPDQDVQFSAGANGSTWINMNDGGGVDTALPDVLVPGETYSFRVRLKNRSLAPDQTHILTLRSESHWRDVKMSLVWNNGAEDAQWFQRLDFKTSSKRNRVYTVRVHVAADATPGNVVFDQYTPPGFWSRAADPRSRWNRHYSRTTVACIACPESDDGPISDSDDAPISDSNDAPMGDSNDARLDEAALIAEVNAHIADFTRRNHANGVRDWNLILDRLEGRTGMSDADIAVWLERAVRHGWQDGVTTLPKVQAMLAAPQPVVVPEVNITGSVGGTEGSDVSFTVSAVPPPTADLAVSVTVSALGDFGVPTGSHTVTIPAGQSSKTLTLSSSDDSVDEPDGSVTLTLNSDSVGGYTVGSLSSQSVQVLDDDDPQLVAAPVVSVSAGAGVTEGGAALFTVSADVAPAADLPVSVTVSASGDYGVVTGSRTVTIAAGTTSKVVSVATVDDSVDEADGSVSVTVADGADYDVGTATATVAVADDDDPPTPVVSVSAGAGVSEGGAASFTLTASPPPASPISVSVSVGASGDFGAVTGSRTVTIGSDGSASFSVATSDDSVDEADGSVSVTVADGADYDVGTASATVSVADDDEPPPVQDVPDTDGIADTDQAPADADACTGKPTVAAADVTARRGDDIEFVISIDCAHTSDVAVHYSVTRDGQLAISDAGIATINSGDTTTTVTLSTTGGVAVVGLYLAYVSEVTNPWGVWAYGTITD